MDHREQSPAIIKRRDFILLGFVAAAGAGCQGIGGGASSTDAGHGKTIDAGPGAYYSKDGVYTDFCSLGFFIVRRGDKLEALSSICTHRKCKLTAEPDHSFYCECHGSTFNPDGKVTEGPARRDLPILTTFTNDIGHLMVTVPG
jgi:Rieske Fe-S protein